ncbi:hypothetical protein ISX56_33830, partial [Serratia ureilytica]|nr:hypothetical protein [Serratia ureilytica]
MPQATAIGHIHNDAIQRDDADRQVKHPMGFLQPHPRQQQRRDNRGDEQVID